MASRMERIYEPIERSKKNENLYKRLDEIEVEDLGHYSNIERVADLSNSNEIDIEMVKKLLREEAKSTKKVKKTPKKENTISDYHEESKNYDLRDVLNKAKDEHESKDNRYRNLDKNGYELLKKLKIKKPEDEEEIKELLHTISLGGGIEDDLGMFDDLKSNTMVGDASSIKKIIDDAKEDEEDEEEADEEESEIDKSFYTASFNLSENDFEDIKSLSTSLKKNNKLMQILIFVFTILVAVLLLVLVATKIF